MINKYKHINLDYLNNLSNNNSSFVNEFTTEFIKLTPLFFEQMEKALTRMQVNKIGKIAHKVRPTCELIGASVLSRLVTSIEKNSVECFKKDLIHELLTEAKEELEKVMEELSHASSKLHS